MIRGRLPMPTPAGRNAGEAVVLLFRCCLAVACAFCAGCCGTIDGLYPPKPGESQREIYIYNNRWHTGFVLNTAELSPRGQQYLTRFGKYPWVEIGWGDDGFYRAPKATACKALQAVFLSHGSVLHAVGVSPDPLRYYRSDAFELYRVRIGEEGYRRLEQYILDTFQTGDDGKPIEIEEGLYGYSYFYAAHGHYSLLGTCNNWTARGLRTTGFPITPAYAQTAGNLGCQITHQGRNWQADIDAKRKTP